MLQLFRFLSSFSHSVLVPLLAAVFVRPPLCVSVQRAHLLLNAKKRKEEKKNSSGKRRQTSGGRRRGRYVVEAKGSWTPIKVSLMPLLMVFDSAANHLKVVCDSAVLFRTATLINSPSYHHFVHGLNSV